MDRKTFIKRVFPKRRIDVQKSGLNGMSESPSSLISHGVYNRLRDVRS